MHIALSSTTGQKPQSQNKPNSPNTSVHPTQTISIAAPQSPLSTPTTTITKPQPKRRYLEISIPPTSTQTKPPPECNNRQLHQHNQQLETQQRRQKQTRKLVVGKATDEQTMIQTMKTEANRSRLKW
jgi:hypothetical protein